MEDASPPFPQTATFLKKASSFFHQPCLSNIDFGMEQSNLHLIQLVTVYPDILTTIQYKINNKRLKYILISAIRKNCGESTIPDSIFRHDFIMHSRRNLNQMIIILIMGTRNSLRSAAFISLRIPSYV